MGDIDLTKYNDPSHSGIPKITYNKKVPLLYNYKLKCLLDDLIAFRVADVGGFYSFGPENKGIFAYKSSDLPYSSSALRSQIFQLLPPSTVGDKYNYIIDGVIRKLNSRGVEKCSLGLPNILPKFDYEIWDKKIFITYNYETIFSMVSCISWLIRDSGTGRLNNKLFHSNPLYFDKNNISIYEFDLQEFAAKYFVNRLNNNYDNYD